MLQWFPLSQGQQARWFQYRLNPAARGDHNNVFVAALDTDAAAAALAAALDALLARHPMLRARLRQNDDGRLEQTVLPAWTGVLQTVDARGLGDEALRARVSADAWRAFGDEEPLLRACLYRRDGGAAVWLLALDHLICDGWSYWRLLGELGAALDAGAAVAAGEGGEGYRDYVQWQAQWLDSAAGERQLDYWRRALPAASAALELPAAQAAADNVGQRAHTLMLDPVSTQQVRALAARDGGSVFGVLLAALQIVLHRYSGHDTVSIGAPVPCRGKPGWRAVVGDFVNMVALRADFGDQTRVADVLAATRSALRGGLRHQDYPVSALIRRLELGAAPFQASAVFQNARDAGPLAELWNSARHGETIARWGDTALSAFPIQQRVALDRMPLALHAIEFEHGLRCDFIHDDARLDAAAIARLAANFATVLRAMLTDPEASVRGLPLLSEAEREQVIEGFNATAITHEGPKLLHEWFVRSARARPQAIALRHGEQQVSYAELDRRSDAIAARLRRLGVQVEDRVAIHLPRGPGLIAAVLGTLKAGAAYVPVDPAYPHERVNAVLRDCGARARIATAALAAAVPARGEAVLDIDDASLAHEPALSPPPAVSANALAYVIYTSGSTGQPKGVMIEHANACNFIAWALRDGGADGFAQVLFATSISFDLAVYEIFATLAAGGTLEIVRDVLEPPRGPVALINTVPSGMDGLLHAQAVPATARRINLAGEPLRAALVERIFAQTGAQSVANLYGPTETTTYSTGVRIDRGQAFAAHIGRPIDNTRIYLVDRAGQPVPIGVAGEICIGGAGVARGYLGRPDLTAERFGADPFAPGGRWYRTGDLGRWTADGDIVYLGRSDHQVKIRGFRIEPGEIEAALGRLDGVAVAAVIAHGEDAGNRRLVAYVVPRPDARLAIPALRDGLSACLPAHMVPAAFVVLAQLPLTPNGKLDRAALPAPGFDSERAYRAPEGDTETRMAAIWSELLGVARVGRDDNFFELGGHSLLAMQLGPRLRAVFGVDVPLAQLFDAPVLRLTAQRVAAAQAAALEALDLQAMRAELEGLSEAELMDILSKEEIDD